MLAANGLVYGWKKQMEKNFLQDVLKGAGIPLRECHNILCHALTFQDKMHRAQEIANVDSTNALGAVVSGYANGPGMAHTAAAVAMVKACNETMAIYDYITSEANIADACTRFEKLDNLAAFFEVEWVSPA